MRHTDRIGTAVAVFTHKLMDVLHLAPGDGAFERIGHNAEVLHSIAQIRIVEASLFPSGSNNARKTHSTVLFADALYVLRNVFAEALFAVGEAEE